MGAALRFASERLRGDAALVLAAVGRDGAALAFASPGLRAKRAFVASCVAADATGRALAAAAPKLARDAALVRAACARHGRALAAAPERFRADRAAVVAALGSPRPAAAAPLVPDALRRDPEVARLCAAALPGLAWAVGLYGVTRAETPRPRPPPIAPRPAWTPPLSANRRTVAARDRRRIYCT